MPVLPNEFASGLCEILAEISKGDLSKAESMLENIPVKPGQESYCREVTDNVRLLINQSRDAKKISEQLRETHLIREKFFSIMSHDLRSPFNAILGFSEILAEEWDQLDEADHKSFLMNIRNTAHNAFELLERLLEWDKVRTGKMRFLPTRLRISSLVEENFIFYTLAAKRKHISLNSEVNEKCRAWADHDAVLLLLRNLVHNAIKFTNHGGSIKVQAVTGNEEVIVTVIDTGIGISADNIPKLFLFDNQLKTDGTDREKGSGLGLVVCREILEKCHGRIWAESSEGIGSRFSFSLPKDLPKQDKP